MKYGIVFFTIGVYGKCGMSEWLWKCTKSSDYIRDYLLCESKVLGSSLTCNKCFLDVGTMTIESVPHPSRVLVITGTMPMGFLLS